MGGLDAPTRLASGSNEQVASGALPYPLIVLGALAAVLLLSGAAGWLGARGR